MLYCFCTITQRWGRRTRPVPQEQWDDGCFRTNQEEKNESRRSLCPFHPTDMPDLEFKRLVDIPWGEDRLKRCKFARATFTSLAQPDIISPQQLISQWKWLTEWWPQESWTPESAQNPNNLETGWQGKSLRHPHHERTVKSSMPWVELKAATTLSEGWAV